ncbi:MAG: RNA methyltransferase [Phycisphaerales bacterium]|nr:RNA methyltransferase [Phycisphaerales bacterium]
MFEGATCITDSTDPRVVQFRSVRDGDLRGRDQLFCAESPRVVRRFLHTLVASHRGAVATPALSLSALLVTPAAAEALGELLGQSRACTSDGTLAPLFLAESSVMSQLAGYKMHKGALALGVRPESPSFDALLATLPLHQHLLIPTGVVHPDNIGAIFRNAGSFGNAGVLLADGCSDPLNRKAIRISSGRVFSVAWGESRDIAGDLGRLRSEFGFAVVAAEESDGSVEIENLFAVPAVTRARRIAVILGSEGHGVCATIRAQCDATCVIAMGDSTKSDNRLLEPSDHPSLNVAVASALFLHRLRGARSHSSAES